jgi:hypothetical protein
MQIPSDNHPFFVPEDLGDITEPVARLIRIVFIEEQITLDDYRNRYLNYLKRLYPEMAPNKVVKKIENDYEAITNSTRVLPGIVLSVLRAMGFHVVRNMIRMPIASVTISYERGGERTYSSVGLGDAYRPNDIHGDAAFAYFCDDNNLPRIDASRQQRIANLRLMADWAMREIESLK